MPETPLFWLSSSGSRCCPRGTLAATEDQPVRAGERTGLGHPEPGPRQPLEVPHRQRRAGRAEPPPATSFVLQPHTGSPLPTLRAARAGPADAASTWSSSERSWPRRPAQVAGAAPPGWRQVGVPRPATWGGGKPSQGTPPRLHDFADPRPHRI